tara:strand:+ start:6138 stop:6602 length:465 start_codon:yes stop_codon:yes gene_type:complete
MLANLKEKYEEVVNSSLFLDWKKEHSEAFLSGAFLQDGWQLDFYDPTIDKVGSFYKENLTEDKMLKKPDTIVKELKLEEVRVDFDKIEEIVARSLKEKSEKEQKRIVLLQVLDDKITWNITVISDLFNVINFKIDGVNGDLISESYNSPLSFRS